MRSAWQWLKVKMRGGGAAPVFVMAMIIYVVLTAMAAYDRERQYENQRATGLGAVARSNDLASVGWEPDSLWKQSTLGGNLADSIGSSDPRMQTAHYLPSSSNGERQVIRNARVRAVTKKPQAAAEQVNAMAGSLGGYTASLQLGNEDKSERATITVLVPASHFDEARSRIRKLADRVELEIVDANDVTREYVDLQASLKNYRAEEAQYLEIMRRSGAVKDVISVAERLADVRGRIEKAEAQFRLMTQQVAMASLTVALRSETEAELLGIQWRPGYRIRRAFRDGVQSLANYADAVMTVSLKLPSVALWLSTAFLLIKLAWMWLQWWWRILRPKSAEAK